MAHHRKTVTWICLLALVTAVYTSQKHNLSIGDTRNSVSNAASDQTQSNITGAAYYDLPIGNYGSNAESGAISTISVNAIHKDHTDSSDPLQAEAGIKVASSLADQSDHTRDQQYYESADRTISSATNSHENYNTDDRRRKHTKPEVNSLSAGHNIFTRHYKFATRDANYPTPAPRHTLDHHNYTTHGANYTTHHRKYTTREVNYTSPAPNHTTRRHNYTTHGANYPTHGANYTTHHHNYTTHGANYTTPAPHHTTHHHNYTTHGANYTTHHHNYTTHGANYTTPAPHHTTHHHNYTTHGTNYTTHHHNYTTHGANYTTPAPHHTTHHHNYTTHGTNYTTHHHNYTTLSPNYTTTAPGNTSTATTTRTTATTPPTVRPPPPKAGSPYGCQKVSPCVCQTEDGARVDLSPLARNDGAPRFQGTVAPGDPYVYYWNPCYAFNQGACSDVAVCQFDPQGVSQQYYDLGGQKSVDFQVSSRHGLMLQYWAPADRWISLRTTYVILVCDPNVEANFTAEGEPVPLAGTYYFRLVSRYACPVGGHSTIPTPPSIPTPATPPTPPTPGSVTVQPTDTPIDSLKTVVDLLFIITVTAAVGLVVLLTLLAAVCLKKRSSRSPGCPGAGQENSPWLSLLPTDHASQLQCVRPDTKLPL